MDVLFRAARGTRRWMIFNFVGIMGAIVQMAMLITLTSVFHFKVLLATALSVEAAVLHNFFWHERWTWADRVAGHGGLFPRFLFFHLANGAFSMAGNLVLMHLFVGKFGLNYIPGNALAILICSILNYLAGDRFVFRAAGQSLQKEVSSMPAKTPRMSIGISPFVAVVLLLGTARADAADLKPETVRAWSEYVEQTERRIRSELSAQTGFLALDFQNPTDSARERQDVLSGKIPIKEMIAAIQGKEKIQIPDGMIHHWRGSVFVPGVTLDFVLARVGNPAPQDAQQEDVVDSRVLERAPGRLRLFLKLQRTKIVTVRYNTEHLIQYQRHGAGRASSSSIATKIAELERIHGGGEKEMPEGHDSGFLWRMNSYWRYQQVPGGVIVECESLTLSRSVPLLLESVLRPIINRVALESLQRTLESMRLRMARSWNLTAGSSKS